MVAQPRHLSAPLVALVAAVVLFSLFVVNLLTLGTIVVGRTWTTRARRTQTLLSETRAGLVDAETGQRGFLLTDRFDYLEPFERAAASVPSDLAELRSLTADDPVQSANLAEIGRLATRKIDEMRRTIDLYRHDEHGSALAIVRSDDGKTLMDNVRRLIEDMLEREDHLLEGRTTRARHRLTIAMWVDAVAGLGLVVLGLILQAISRDIARRTELEKALRDASAFQERFVAILGHDLRNPLSAITLAADRLHRASLADGQARAVARISSSTARMRRMVDQLLDLTRARLAGGIPVHPQPDTDLREVVRATVEELRAAHPGAACALHADISVKGSWDPDRLGQLVSNLVGNAIIHGSGQVEVGVERIRGSAVITVQNGGPAIPPEFLPRIFEPFHRPADQIRSTGLGLGLFIAERIVVAHGGKIDVRSNEREGTTFTIRLPLLPGSASTISPSLLSPGPSVPETGPLLRP